MTGSIVLDGGHSTIETDHKFGLHKFRPREGACALCDAWAERVAGQSLALMIESYNIRMERRARKALDRLCAAYTIR